MYLKRTIHACKTHGEVKGLPDIPTGDTKMEGGKLEFEELSSNSSRTALKPSSMRHNFHYLIGNSRLWQLLGITH